MWCFDICICIGNVTKSSFYAVVNVIFCLLGVFHFQPPDHLVLEGMTHVLSSKLSLFALPPAQPAVYIASPHSYIQWQPPCMPHVMWFSTWWHSSNQSPAYFNFDTRINCTNWPIQWNLEVAMPTAFVFPIWKYSHHIHVQLHIKWVPTLICHPKYILLHASIAFLTWLF